MSPPSACTAGRIRSITLCTRSRTVAAGCGSVCGSVAGVTRTIITSLPRTGEEMQPLVAGQVIDPAFHRLRREDAAGLGEIVHRFEQALHLRLAREAHHARRAFSTWQLLTDDRQMLPRHQHVAEIQLSLDATLPEPARLIQVVGDDARRNLAGGVQRRAD